MCLQFSKLSGDMKNIFWENFAVAVIIVDGSAVGKCNGLGQCPGPYGLYHCVCVIVQMYLLIYRTM